MAQPAGLPPTPNALSKLAFYTRVVMRAAVALGLGIWVESRLMRGTASVLKDTVAIFVGGIVMAVAGSGSLTYARYQRLQQMRLPPNKRLEPTRRMIKE